MRFILLFLAFGGAVGLSAWAQAACLNNVVEFRNDTADGSYFFAQTYATTILPQDRYRLSRRNANDAADPGQWVGDGSAPIEGSQLIPTNALAWSIEVHYRDDAIDEIGEWKQSALTGNRYAVVRGKHVPPLAHIEYPATYRDQQNVHLSLRNVHRADDWDELNDLIDDILEDRDGQRVVGYGNLDRGSPPRQIIGKLAKWIKNKRLSILMNGGSNVDGFIHPNDFMTGKPSYCQGASSALTTMAAQLGITARLGETVDHSWVEVFIDGQWLFVENQPETFLDVIFPPIAVYTYPKDGQRARGHQPQSPEEADDALDREAVMAGGLIDIIADPKRFGFVDGANRFSWFFDWTNPFVYDPNGEVYGGEAALVMRPEVYSDSIFNLYVCTYSDAHNASQCGGDGRQFEIAEWYSSMWELAALYPGRQHDLPYVFAKDQGNDTNVMYLTPIRGNTYANHSLRQTKIAAGSGVRKQFYLSEREAIEAVYAVLYLGPNEHADYGIPDDGGNWYFSVNGHRVSLGDAGGLQLSDGRSNGVESDYVGLGQRVLRHKLDLNQLKTDDGVCD